VKDSEQSAMTDASTLGYAIPVIMTILKFHSLEHAHAGRTYILRHQNNPNDGVFITKPRLQKRFL
jgi:hypothetical protein